VRWRQPSVTLKAVDGLAFRGARRRDNGEAWRRLWNSLRSMETRSVHQAGLAVSASSQKLGGNAPLGRAELHSTAGAPPSAGPARRNRPHPSSGDIFLHPGSSNFRRSAGRLQHGSACTPGIEIFRRPQSPRF